MSAEYEKLVRRLETMPTWKKVADPATDWLASKTSGWTADSFSGGLEVDFSDAVPAGTKAVRVVYTQATTQSILYYRKYNDTNISNTPGASQEYSHRISYALTGDQIVVWLSDDYKAQFAVGNVNTDLYIAYPVEILL